MLIRYGSIIRLNIEIYLGHLNPTSAFGYTVAWTGSQVLWWDIRVNVNFVVLPHKIADIWWPTRTIQASGNESWMHKVKMSGRKREGAVQVVYLVVEFVSSPFITVRTSCFQAWMLLLWLLIRFMKASQLHLAMWLFEEWCGPESAYL